MTVKNQKLDVRPFQSSWTSDYGFVLQRNRAICAICRKSVVFRTTSVQRHFQTRHESRFKDNADRTETIRRAAAQYTKISQGKDQATYCSFKIAQSLAEKARPFTAVKFMKQAFLRSTDVLFDVFPNKQAILVWIKDIPASAQTIERRVTEMVENVRKQKIDAIKRNIVFSILLDENIDFNDISGWQSLRGTLTITAFMMN